MVLFDRLSVEVGKLTTAKKDHVKLLKIFDEKENEHKEEILIAEISSWRKQRELRM